jgi:hypothetical protein
MRFLLLNVDWGFGQVLGTEVSFWEKRYLDTGYRAAGLNLPWYARLKVWNPAYELFCIALGGGPYIQ